MREIRLVLHASLCISLAGGFAVADQDDNYTNLADALANGAFGVGWRYRLETVDDDGFLLDGTSSTLRTAVSYRSAGFHHLRAAFELENLTDVGAGDRHDNLGAGSLFNGVTGRPVVADPELTEVNQVYLAYDGFSGTEVALGRQEFGIADERFFGAVGWRQNHQTFEALRLRSESVRRTKITYAYLTGANRINGGDWDQDSHVLDVEIAPCRHGTLSPYYYDQDFDDQRAGVSASTRTIGLRWGGTVTAGDWKLPYHLEYANQTDHGDNPDHLDADYHRVWISADRGGLRLKLLYEVLGGDAVDGRFETPQATLHAFNGWADRFLRTPDNGLIDLAVTAGYAWRERRVTASLTYHDFGADSSGPDHGAEIDGMIAWKTAWGQSFGFKFASYRADDADVLEDVTKFWCWSGYSF